MTWAELSGLQPGSRIKHKSEVWRVLGVRDLPEDTTFGRKASHSMLLQLEKTPASRRRRVLFTELLGADWQVFQPATPPPPLTGLKL